MPDKKVKTMAIDLVSLDTSISADAGVDIELLHPGTRKKLGIFINICGVDSEKYREAMRKKQNKRLENAKVGSLASAEEIEEESIDLLARCTNGWRNMVLEGKELEYSLENAKAVYSRFSWIKEQIDTAIGNRALFLPS